MSFNGTLYFSDHPKDDYLSGLGSSKDLSCLVLCSLNGLRIQLVLDLRPDLSGHNALEEIHQGVFIAKEPRDKLRICICIPEVLPNSVALDEALSVFASNTVRLMNEFFDEIEAHSIIIFGNDSVEECIRVLK